ncbi:OmpA family protein [Aequorivita echinoideorum]|uniref:OmpA family protein n=1 Tax=Aequorivita echinoideorum TaxID=1549647 RepID=A0ABS5S692_9FLAO|nr:OmpA family protein [Aequorivita echinoideorum]MBT0608734.1 OmpA family protein [Aequorivita echinoideorum]
MKKTVLALALLTATFATAQEEVENFDYNKWSIELGGGFHKPSRQFAPGYFTHTPSFGQFSLGVRYMLNDRFGLKVDAGYSTIENDDNSLPFKSNYYRGSLQGVVNLGNVLRFSDWTNSVGLLFHGGAGYSLLSPKEPIELDDNDPIFHVVGGLTPQVKLGERVAIFTDISLIGNVNQDYTWDGTQFTDGRGFKGFKVDFSVGLNIYLGGNEKHADWAPREDVMKDRVAALEERVTKLENDLLDSDMDGVPDYLDREPNTMSGVTVDSKGVAVDKNKNGIPDEIESSLDQRFVTKEEFKKNGQNGGVDVSELLNKGYVNVYFQFNSDKPETYSLEAINYLIKYMKDNPSANAELIGYADELGNPEYNQELSERRANKVKEILVASGVAEGRLTTRGGGEDTTVEKGSAPARQLVRRVTFRLN